MTNGEPEAPKAKNGEKPGGFDWVKTIQVHPIVIAGGLLVSGATGAVGGYIALQNFVRSEVKAAIEQFKPDAVAPLVLRQHVSDDDVPDPTTTETLVLAACDANETAVSGACVLQKGNDPAFRIKGVGIYGNHNGRQGYGCIYDGGTKVAVRAYVYCADRARVKLVQ